MKRILLLNGSAGGNKSANHLLLTHIADQLARDFQVELVASLASLPHFESGLSETEIPRSVGTFRKKIDDADGVIISAPEYVFSIPSGLKNAIEWCISTIVFSEKPLGILTASASGAKAHEELQLIMKTAGAKFVPETTLLIAGVKGKIDATGTVTDRKAKNDLAAFAGSFSMLVNGQIDEIAPEISCRLATPELQQRKQTISTELKKDIVETVENDNGYAFRFASSDEMIDRLTAFIKTENACCPFFDFGLQLRQKEIWLSLTGSQGAKEFVRTELGWV